MPVSATTVTQYYTGIFRQAPSTAVSTAYQSMANDATALQSMLSAANVSVDPVVRLYQTAFNRLPDNAGMTSWVSAFSTGAITLQQIANGFTTSTEFTNLYPTSMSNSQFVGALYYNILQRAGEDAGIKGWVDALNKGALTRAQVLLGFSESGEFTAKIEPAVNSFLTSIANTAVANQGSAALYTGSLFDQSGAPTTTYNLTTAIDTATANVFNGLVNGAAGTDTFTPLDTLTGLNGNAAQNSLRLLDGGVGGALATAMITPLGATLSNVGTLNIVALDDIGALSTAGAPFTGVTNVTVSNAGAITGLVAGSGQALTVTNTAAANAAGGGAAAMAVDGGASQTITITGAVFDTDTDIGAALNVGATTATTGAVNVTVNNTSSVAAAGDVTTGGAITVRGGSTVTVNQTMTATAAAAATVLTGNITVANTQGAVTVTGTTATTAVVINQSAAVAAAASATAGVIGTVAGDTTVNDVNRTSLTAAGTITTVTLNNSGAAVINSGALTTLNLAGTLTTVNAGTLGALTTAANTALAINLTGAVTTGAVTIDTDITTINIAASGTASTLANLVNASATAVNVSGAAGLTITADTLAATATITSTNTAGVTISQALLVGQGFVGGDGADSILVGQTTKAITMGAGNDVVTISDTTLGTGGSIDGGAGVNTIVANTNGSSLAANTSITNFTTLRVAGAAAQGTHSAAGFTALEVGGAVVLAGATTFSSVAANTGLTYLGTTGQTTAYQLTNSAGTADVLNVTLRSAAAINANTLTAAGIETVNITSTDTNTTAHQNTFALVATGATTITVTGNAGLAFTNDATNTKVALFDASGVTGAAADAALLAVTYVSNTAVANSATTTIKGGSGNDALTGGLTADAISGNDGNDVLDGGRGADNIDGGTGTNTFVAVASGIASVEGAGTGTTAGMAINLGSTAVTAAAINGAMGGTIGLSGASTSLAAGTAQYIFATQSNLFAATTDTLTNIQNVTGSAGSDYIVGSASANVINGLAGIDQLTGGLGADTFVMNQTANANRKVISDFTVAQGDILGLSQAVYTNMTGAVGSTVTVLTNATAGALITADVAGSAANSIVVATAAQIAALDFSAGNVTAAGAMFAVASDTGELIYDADGDFAAGTEVIGTVTAAQAALIAASNVSILA
jgi:S-layer protein